MDDDQAIVGVGDVQKARCGAVALVAEVDPLVDLVGDDPRPGRSAMLEEDALLPLLRAIPGVQVATPRGGLYAFLRAPGSDDSLAFAKRLVQDAGVGIAPGAAFGAEGEGWLRWCFASREPARLGVGAERLAAFLRL